MNECVCRARVSQEKQIHLGEDPTLRKTVLFWVIIHRELATSQSGEEYSFYPFLSVSRGDLDKLGFASS